MVHTTIYARGGELITQYDLVSGPVAPTSLYNQVGYTTQRQLLIQTIPYTTVCKVTLVVPHSSEQPTQCDFVQVRLHQRRFTIK